MKTNETNCTSLPNHDEVIAMFPDNNIIDISDPRDIIEIKRRQEAKTCSPYKNELYSVNPTFNGIYTDPGRLTEGGKRIKGYSMGFIH